MKRFNQAVACVKCGGDQASSQWVYARCASNIFGVISPAREESIERKCINCKYGWPELPLDSGEEEK